MEYHKINEWPLKVCKVKEAWELDLPAHGLGKNKGEGIIIVHPDTGWTPHPELTRPDGSTGESRYLFKIAPSYFSLITVKGGLIGGGNAEDLLMADADYLRLSPSSSFHPSHGTSTASLMMSDEGHPNDPELIFPNYHVPKLQFVTGIAPKVKVIPVQITNSVLLRTNVRNASGEDINLLAALAKAIHFAVSYKKEIGVISISLGSPFENQIITSALKEARRNGIIVCAAAGQTRELIPESLRKVANPARSPHAIGVAGCDINYNKPSEGHYGLEVDITAPGWDLTVARTLRTESGDVEYVIDNKELRSKSVSGTSYSTALASGACALWQAYHSRSWLIKTYGRPFFTRCF